MNSPFYDYPGKVAAFLDIGTNSIRLLLVRINPNHSYTILSDQKEMVRLGEGEFIEGALRPEAMQRATLVVRKFTEMARAYNAEEVIAVATAATREAENRADFLRQIKTDAGLEVHLVSGREEARLIYLGVASGVHLGDQKSLFIDIGGGSTEIILGGQSEYEFLDSFKLGAIRLTSLFFLPEETAPVDPTRYALIQQYIRNIDVRAVQALQDQSFELAYGSSGTIENLADIAFALLYKRRRTRDDILLYSDLKKVVTALCELPLEERSKLPGINPARADIIIAGAAILDTLLGDLGVTKLHVSDRGLRDGLLIDYLSRSEHTGHLEGASVRERSVLQLGRACNFDENHARNMARLALELFDSARQAGLHKWGGAERELLQWAAFLHDIGVFISYNNHQSHSHYIIRNSDLLGFDSTEIEILAVSALFHRKAMPRARKHPEFAALDQRSRRLVRLFALLLRLAESLDRSHTGVVRNARLEKQKDRQALLTIEARSECQLELWGAQTHREAFEKVFGRTLLIDARVESATEQPESQQESAN